MVTFENRDCMQAMKEFPDNYFDLAIVDPPYGDGGGYSKGKTRADLEDASTSGRKYNRFGGMFSKSINGTPTRKAKSFQLTPPLQKM